MNNKGLIIIFLLLLDLSGIAQPIQIPVYEIKADTPIRFLPDEHWQMLIDTNGKWGINDVTSSPLNDRFHTNNTKQTGVGYSGINYYWQRLRLKNNTGKEQKLIFGNRPWVDYFELYVVRNTGETEHLISGPWIPHNERDGYKRRHAVPVVMAAGEEVVLYKKLFIKKNENLNELIIGFSFYEPFIEQAYINTPWRGDDVRNWFIADFLIFGFFLNFFFFWIVREKVYFYLALLLLSEGLWYTTLNSGITFKNFPEFLSLFKLIVTHILVFFSAAQFVRHFLKTHKYYPRWDKLIIVLMILMIISHLSIAVFINSFTYSLRGIPHFVNALFFAALMFALLISFLFFRKEKNRLTTLGVIAALPALILWSIGYLFNRIYDFREIRYSKTPPDVIQKYFNLEFVIEMFCVAWFAILFTWILLQRYALLRKQLIQQALEREKEKTELINKQNELLEKEVEERTAELKQSLEELKTTQKQLIESEKMASLGELTAGIAHEIQNPLNFVNNFSEVSAELADELKKEVTQGDKEESIAIAEDLKQNLQKIVHHGKRADAIVKGMLQHSRASTGKKEPTDINALADEYLRLSYHGLRAKDKTFNATMKADYDKNLNPVSVVPQDIGRVLLNLITNAFYSVTEKKKLLNGEFEPTVTVATKKLNDKVQVSVKDNGTGIPQKAVDKIFQPFFSTKPTGEGTGLGLSISYDIIKAHGGELSVESKEGEGAEFLVKLPFTEIMT